MAPLSDLSIGFIVGGCVIFVSLILGFLVWRIIVHKRSAKFKDLNSNTGRSRVETGTANVHFGNHRDDRDSEEPESVQAVLHLESDHHRTTTNKNIDSGTDDRKRIPANDNKDDSGYGEIQGSNGPSEVYSRLHEGQNHVENVYSDLTEKDVSQGSGLPVNSVSVNSEDKDKHGTSSFSVATPTSETSSNQRGTKSGVYIVPVFEKPKLDIEEEDRMDINHFHRPAHCEHWG